MLDLKDSVRLTCIVMVYTELTICISGLDKDLNSCIISPYSPQFVLKASLIDGSISTCLCDGSFVEDWLMNNDLFWMEVFAKLSLSALRTGTGKVVKGRERWFEKG